MLGAAENELLTEVAGLFRVDDVKKDPEHPVSTTSSVAGMFRAIYLATGESSPLYEADEAMEVEAVALRFANGDEDECIEEAGRMRRTTLSITDLR